MNIVVIGAVASTRILIEELLREHIKINMVFSLDESVSRHVSGYYPLHELAEKEGIPYTKYKKINEEKNIQIMRDVKPDYIFAIGFSQLISKKILDIPTKGVIGCHPSDLPAFRGRAVLVWQMLIGIKNSNVTMFYMDEGADSGDIIGKEPFQIGESDYISDLLVKTDAALLRLYKKVIPQIVNGTLKLEKQDDSKATYCLKRTPEDGQIDWTQSGKDIMRIIRAISHPYPGAFSYYDKEHKIIIWRAHIEENKKYYGFPGQIAEIHSDGKMVIITTDGLLVIDECENIDKVKLIAGHRLSD